MIFETEQDLIREKKAIDVFVKLFGGSYKKLDPNDIDYKVFDKDGNLISYVEVRSRIRTIYNSYPLPVEAKRLVKLMGKRLNPVIIWACEDGIVYGKVIKLKGEVRWGRGNPLDNSFSDTELIVYYEKQKEFKYVRYV